MEKLLQYIWKHKLLPLGHLTTTTGQSVEIIDAGLQNRDAGPDFFNAKVMIGGTLWVGNVEIHERSSEWNAHGHALDARYDNVVLHVVSVADCTVVTHSGRELPQLVMCVPDRCAAEYAALLNADRYPPCQQVVANLPRLSVHSWLAALQTERLQQKAEAIRDRADSNGGDWEKAFFITMARNFGFGVNGDAFELWAKSLPLDAAAHHRDDAFQVEAIFMGQAGLLDAATISPRSRAEAEADDFFQRLRREFAYLAHKFRLTPMEGSVWRFLRLRPQNFPYIRISQLANLYCSRRCLLSKITECATVEDVRRVVQTEATPYWQTHYTFGRESRQSSKSLSARSVDLLIVNTVVPTLFAYGRHIASERLCHRASAFLEELHAEDNHIVRTWAECGVKAENAGDSQAIVQLQREYCDRRDCLRCRFGYEYLKRGFKQQ